MSSEKSPRKRIGKATVKDISGLLQSSIVTFKSGDTVHKTISDHYNQKVVNVEVRIKGKKAVVPVNEVNNITKLNKEIVMYTVQFEAVEAPDVPNEVPTEHVTTEADDKQTDQLAPRQPETECQVTIEEPEPDVDESPKKKRAVANAEDAPIAEAAPVYSHALKIVVPQAYRSVGRTNDVYGFNIPMGPAHIGRCIGEIVFEAMRRLVRKLNSSILTMYWTSGAIRIIWAQVDAPFYPFERINEFEFESGKTTRLTFVADHTDWEYPTAIAISRESVPKAEKKDPHEKIKALILSTDDTRIKLPEEIDEGMLAVALVNRKYQEVAYAEVPTGRKFGVMTRCFTAKNCNGTIGALKYATFFAIGTDKVKLFINPSTKLVAAEPSQDVEMINNDLVLAKGFIHVVEISS